MNIYLYCLYNFYKSQHNPSTRGGQSIDNLKQSNNVTMEMENDEVVDPWIIFCALREEETLLQNCQYLTLFTYQIFVYLTFLMCQVIQCQK